jgi:hypothetical protein
MVVLGIGYEPFLRNIEPVTAWCEPANFIIAKRIGVDLLADHSRIRYDGCASHSTVVRISVDALSNGAYEP